MAEVGTDLISRQAAIDALHMHLMYRMGTDSNKKRLDDWINGLPSAQPATNCSEFPNNSDTISREAVADAINGIECTRHTTWYEFYQKVMTAVEKLPSAHPEIIRCRECKFASGDSRICMKFDHSPIGELDFCSFAERREVTT